MKISILTLFPEMFAGPFDHSIIKRAQEKRLVEISYVNIRDFGIGRHKVVDDRPYGGGTGMVLKVDVLHKAIEQTKSKTLSNEKQRVVLLDARGKVFNQSVAYGFTELEHLILICGHYEGVDERIRQFVDEEISIGDYILTGGEIPAMAITDATVRLLSGVLKENATIYESFSHKRETLLEYPQYTTPRIYNNFSVPDVLVSGNHQKIQEWKQKQEKEITHMYRNDLLKNDIATIEKK